MDNSKGYEVIFSLRGLSLAEQNEFYNFLMRELSFDLKDRLNIMVIDPVGGRHDVFRDIGYQPNGTECLGCKRVDCRGCPRAEEDYGKF